MDVAGETRFFSYSRENLLRFRNVRHFFIEAPLKTNNKNEIKLIIEITRPIKSDKGL